MCYTHVGLVLYSKCVNDCATGGESKEARGVVPLRWSLTNKLTASQQRLVAPMCSAVPPLKQDVRLLSRSVKEALRRGRNLREFTQRLPTLKDTYSLSNLIFRSSL